MYTALLACRRSLVRSVDHFRGEGTALGQPYNPDTAGDAPRPEGELAEKMARVASAVLAQGKGSAAGVEDVAMSEGGSCGSVDLA